MNTKYIVIASIFTLLLASCTHTGTTKENALNVSNEATELVHTPEWTDEEMEKMAMDHMDNDDSMSDDNMGTITHSGAMEKDTMSDHQEDTAEWTDEEMEKMAMDHMDNDDTMSSDHNEAMEDIPQITSSVAMYKEYDGTISKKSVLFFHASWCPSCIAADEKISTETELAIDTDILKVDYDSNSELREKYDVRSQHTFVLVDENGEMIKKMVGGTTSSDLIALFN